MLVDLLFNHGIMQALSIAGVVGNDMYVCVYACIGVVGNDVNWGLWGLSCGWSRAKQSSDTRMMIYLYRILTRMHTYTCRHKHTNIQCHAGNAVLLPSASCSTLCMLFASAKLAAAITLWGSEETSAFRGLPSQSVIHPPAPSTSGASTQVMAGGCRTDRTTWPHPEHNIP